MKTMKTIAIIGATGSMGSSIAKILSMHQYRIVLTGRNDEKLQALKDRLNGDDTQAIIESNACEKEVSWQADVIIMACPSAAEKEVAEKIREVATGKIVVSISNPLHVADISAAEELQKLLPHSKVAKVFDTTLAGLPSRADEGKRSDAFIASNNGNAVEVISELVAAAGLNPVAVGDLSVSRALERMQRMISR
jgi:predicted dinucleotide-binding enzyme